MNLKFYDLHPETETFRDSILKGLLKPQKQISPKFFYDKRGSELFDQICNLKEYYLTRTEVSLMEKYLGEMVDLIGSNVFLIEYGAGSINKVRILLNALPDPSAYVPIDISKEHLLDAARTLALTYPDLQIFPIHADFTTLLELPVFPESGKSELRPNQLIFFPGSTLGNFEPDAAIELLKIVLGHLGPRDGLLIGVDLLKEEYLLRQAYNDAAGITAQFNLNLLVRINREIHGEFDLQGFQHRAIFNSSKNRMEMHIQSLKEQTVQVEGTPIQFKKGEIVHTENSYKYTVDGFYDLIDHAGLKPVRTWVDQDRLFSIHFLSAK